MNISRRNMNRILARALSGSLLFTAALPVTALAQTDDGNQTEDERQIAEETAASLQDGVLEYGELQDMIRLYNPDMEQALASYNNTLEQYTEARAQLKRGQYSVSTDKEEAEDNGDTEDYAYYASEEAIDKSAAASYQDMYESMQETSSTSSLRQTERQMTVAAQALMISYDTMQLEKETAEKMCQLYEKQYELAQTKQQAGMATQADVLSANEQLLNARASLETIQESQDEIYRSLCLMVGQETDGSLTIAEIPSADVSKIDSYDLESDTQKAIGNNYTLMSERHTSSGGTTSGVNNKKRNVAESEENLKIQMESLYNDILQKKQELEAEKTAYEKAVQEKNLADTKYSLGMMSQTDYLSAEMAAIQAEADYRSADLALVQAMDTYEWAVLGIADVE